MRAEQKWAAAGITCYDVAVSLYCVCLHIPTPLHFQVRDGVSVSPGLHAGIRASTSDVESVEAIFALIRFHLDRQPARLAAGEAILEVLRGRNMREHPQAVAACGLDDLSDGIDRQPWPWGEGNRTVVEGYRNGVDAGVHLLFGVRSDVFAG